jgi:sterol desaturase/sphingolipid hydroxylase (fatty acid hydroxylase superfamily)
MRLSKTAYYADFSVYAFIVMGSLIWGITQLNPAKQLEALIAMIVGVATWTLVEYVMHRFIFHGRSPIAPLHARHHAEPRAYIGTPTWLSAAIISCFIFIPVWLILSLPIAAGLGTGFVLAFLWYGIVHHLIHHRAKHLTPLLREAAKRHFRHHHGAFGHGNFGLTTAFWDRVFATYLQPPSEGKLRMARDGVKNAKRSDIGHRGREPSRGSPCGRAAQPGGAVVSPDRKSP